MLTNEQVELYRKQLNIKPISPNPLGGSVADRIRKSTIQEEEEEKPSVWDRVKSANPLMRPKETWGDIKETGSDIKNTITKHGADLRETLGAYGSGEQGALSTIAQGATNLATSVSGVAGDLIKGGAKVAIPEESEQLLKEKVGQGAEAFMNIPRIQNFIKNYESNLDQKSPEAQRNVKAAWDAVAFLSEFVGAESGIRAAKVGSKAGGEILEAGGRGARELAQSSGQAFKEGGKILEQVTSGIGNMTSRAKESTSIITENFKRIPSRMATNIGEKQIAEQAIKSLPRKTAQTAVRDGVDIADVKTIGDSLIPENKGYVKELLDSVKKYSSGDKKLNPIEVVGRPLTVKLKALDSEASKVGKELGDVANNLGVVTKKELVQPVFNSLKKISGLEDLKLGINGKLNFKNTILESIESASDRKAIQSIFSQATKWGNGKNKHLLRQNLFDILGGKKRALTELTKTKEEAYEAVRKGLANVLGGKNSKYKTLNQKYAKIVDPLSKMRRMMKDSGFVDQDILDMKGGLLARRLTSNAGSNPEIESILRAIDGLVPKGIKGADANIEQLQNLYNVLNKYYDIAPATGFQGQTTRALESSGGLSGALLDRVNKIAGGTPAVRQKALENLLNELLSN